MVNGRWFGAVAGVVVATAMATAVRGDDLQIIDSSSSVLKEFMALPAKQIPQSLLADAKGVAIIPRVVKGGFVIGVHHGRGVLVTRDEQNRWTPPMMVTFSGGGVGWQAGLQSTDLILVFRTAAGVQRVIEGKMTIGVDASAAAGPIGRQATAATDPSFTAEIFSYSRSRGLFVGVAIDGSALQVDHAATHAIYRTNAMDPVVPAAGAPLPPQAERLVAQMTALTKAGAPVAPVDSGNPRYSPPLSPAPVTVRNVDTVRRELAASSDRLLALVDDNWKSYLVVPRETLAEGQTARSGALAPTVRRFDAIAADPKYAALNQRAEFKQTQALLHEYYEMLVDRPSSLNLPPPPPSAP